MPEYYEGEWHGVHITVLPKKSFLGIRNKSKPIRTGEKVHLEFVFKKLSNFDKEYWTEKTNQFHVSIIQRMPDWKDDEIARINFNDDGKFILNFESQHHIVAEGNVIYKIVKVIVGRYEFNSNRTLEVFSAKAESDEWEKYWRRKGIFWGFVTGLVLFLLQILYNIYFTSS